MQSTGTVKIKGLRASSVHLLVGIIMSGPEEEKRAYDQVPSSTPDDFAAPETGARGPSAEDALKLSEVIIQARPDGSQILPPSLQDPPSTWLSRLCSCFSGRPMQPQRRRTRVSILKPQNMGNRGKATLVLDLDETLVHSSFEPLRQADFELQLNLEDRTYRVYVLVRPKAQQFLIQASQVFEVVIFTASLRRYADLVIAKIDPKGVVSQSLYREHCTLLSGGYVKDLARLGRKLKRTVIVDVGGT